MTDKRADLHIHTHFSDSTRSPQEVVALACEAGLTAISIADHDTVEAVSLARAAAEVSGLEVVAGVELSSEHQGKDIHILGYCFDMVDSPLVRALRDMQDARMDRMRKMVMKLEELGIRDISFDEVAARTRSDAVGRLHLAQVLLERGQVRNLNEAFDRYLGEDAPAYFPKYHQTPYDAIKLIVDSGGVAVMAHPMLTQRDELIPSFVEAGLGGIECFYPNCSMDTVNYYLGLVTQYGLVPTGGSDDHGAGKPSTYIGKGYVPYEHVEEMKRRLLISNG